MPILGSTKSLLGVGFPPAQSRPRVPKRCEWCGASEALRRLAWSRGGALVFGQLEEDVLEPLRFLEELVDRNPLSNAAVPTDSNDVSRTDSQSDPFKVDDGVVMQEGRTQALRIGAPHAYGRIRVTCEPFERSPCDELPRLTTTTSSTVCATSASTWLEIRTVRPSAAKLRRKSRSQRMP